MISINYTNKKTNYKIYGIIGATITLVFPYILMLGNSNNHLEGDQSFCPFKMLTGFPCPGCGITKSLVYFYDGQFYKSLSYHILGPFVIAFCVVTILVLSTELLTKKEYFNGWLYNKKVAYFLGFALVVYHSLRLIYFINQSSFESILKESIWK